MMWVGCFCFWLINTPNGKIQLFRRVFHERMAREILEECVRQDVLVDEDFVAFYVAHLPEETQEIGRIVNFLADKKRPALITLKMQFYLSENPASVEKIKQKYRENLKQKTAKLSREILEGLPKTKEERRKFLRRIVVDLVVNSNIGSPANERVLEETEAALKSVIAESDVVTFSSLRRVDKVRTLDDLRRIVCGIRVFNNDAGHCGEGIVNLAEIVEKSLEATINLLTASLEQCKKRSSLYGSFLASCLTGKGIKLPASCSEELFEIFKEIGILCIQHENFVSSLNSVALSFKFDVFRTLDSFRTLLKSIHEKVKYRAAIPTDEIYPKFKDLGVLWQELQDCVYVLSELNLMNDNLAFFADRTSSYDDIVAGMPPKDSGTDKTDNSEKESEEKIEKIAIPGYLKDVKAIEEAPGEKIAFSSFCPWALAHGILLLGNKFLGFAEFNESRCFTFYSKEFSWAFLTKIAPTERKIIKECTSRPELKILLENQTNDKPAEEILVKSVKVDQEIQTELHPIPPFFDRSHSPLRTDKKLRCHSTQTLRESCTQTIEVQDKKIQTNSRK
ncbi:cilia- and flagella-associated protein 206-like [Lutzomyia longipalpis]|uniref:cilia- and flagella-associated protein 206-like n=1 Tax=Lutzomyia longipalpis TaxID=7200 RepID=UPI0024843D1C|nr:cilia- and flagella-associated protein 206-like [Lutzomyia longipalpis]